MTPTLTLAQFMEARQAQAAAAQSVAYPVNTALPRFNEVPICLAGEGYTPRGWMLNNGQFSPDAAYLQGFVDAYDPFFCCATLNTDHSSWWGPAWGLLLNLAVKGGQLLADLVNVDPELADDIDAGRWPTRSIEWEDASNEHAWAQWFASPGEYVPPESAFFFYGRHHHYLTGLGLLGQRLPAVHSLGPMPHRVSGGTEQAGEPTLPEYLLAATRKPVQIHRLAASHGASRFTTTLIPTQEAEMPVPKDAPQGAQTGGGAAANKPESLPPDNTPQAQRPDPATAAQLEAQQREIRDLQAQVRANESEKRLNTHLANGRLTTQAQREAYTELLGLLHGQPAPQACQASKLPEIAGAATAAQLLDVIISGFPKQVELGAAAPHATGSDRQPVEDDPDAKARTEAINAAIAARKEGK